MPLFVKVNERSWFVGCMFCVLTVRAPKMGRLMRLMFGQEPGTTTAWFRAEKAKGPVERVKKGSSDGMRSSRLR